MSSKSKKRIRSKIGTTEIRTPISLQQLATNQKLLSVHRGNTEASIPFIKTRGFTPAAMNSYSENNTKPSHSLNKYHSSSENFARSGFGQQNNKKLLLNIEINSSDEGIRNSEEEIVEEESNRKAYQEYQTDLQKIKKEYEEKICFHAQDTSKIISKKYKNKYKGKLQEILNKQSEIHKFQIDSLKKHYEAKILKYKEIIEKLHHENEELVHGKSKVKHTDLINPLIEENLWLKQQLNSLKSLKKP